MSRPRWTGRLKLGRVIAVSLLCWCLLVVLHLSGALSLINLKLLDLRFRVRGERTASDAIALIEVDDKTIGAYGQWPLPRQTYALLLAALTDAGARAVGVDLLFVDPVAQDRGSDALLAAVTARSPGVCHAISFISDRASSGSEASVGAAERAALERHGTKGALDIPAAVADAVLAPFPELLEASATVGHVTVAIDRDGAIRRLPLFVRYRGDLYPAMGLQLAALSKGYEAAPRVERDPSGAAVVWPDGKRLSVPIDDEGGTAINLAGDRAAFRRSHSMLQVLRWLREGKHELLAEEFGGRTVLIGNTAVGEAATDIGSTPFSVATPLVYVHANALDAILAGRFLHQPSMWAYLLALAGLSLLLGGIFAALPSRVAAGAMGGAVGVIAVADQALFALWGLDVPPAFPLLLPILAYISIETYCSVFLERKSRERDKELEIAHQVQQKLFPTALPSVLGWEFAGICRPAREVGGDYYDLMEIDSDHVAFALGDVSGKGLGPSLLMSSVHALVRSHLRRPGASPGQLIAELNEHLCSSTSAGMFITIFLGVLDVRTGALLYVNGGHNPGILVESGGGAPARLDRGGIIVGAMPGACFEQGEVTLQPGSTLVLFSDGVTEATNEQGEMLDEERLASLLVSTAGLGAAETLERILDLVDRFRGRCEIGDDLSVVVVCRQPAG